MSTALTTLYSVRDALGRELWWTTARREAVRLAAELNTAGVGARLFIRAAHKPYGGLSVVSQPEPVRVP